MALESQNVYWILLWSGTFGRQASRDIARRALWLEKLIAYMKTKPGAWFATHEEVARYVKTAAE